MKIKRMEQSRPVVGEIAETQYQKTTDQVEPPPLGTDASTKEQAEKPETLREQIDWRFEKFAKYLNRTIKSKRFRTEMADELIVKQYIKSLEDFDELALNFKCIGPEPEPFPISKSSTSAPDQK